MEMYIQKNTWSMLVCYRSYYAFASQSRITGNVIIDKVGSIGSILSLVLIIGLRGEEIGLKKEVESKFKKEFKEMIDYAKRFKVED